MRIYIVIEMVYCDYIFLFEIVWLRPNQITYL